MMKIWNKNTGPDIKQKYNPGLVFLSKKSSIPVSMIFVFKLIIWNIDINTCLLDNTFLCSHLLYKKNNAISYLISIQVSKVEKIIIRNNLNVIKAYIYYLHFLYCLFWPKFVLFRAKLYNKKRHSEKIQMKKT